MTKRDIIRKRRAAHRRRSNPLILVLVGIGLLVIGLVASGSMFKQSSDEDTPHQEPADAINSVVPVEVDYAAPELNVTGLLGEPVSLHDYEGQVRLVNNWATWCPPCMAEMPTLLAYYEAHKSEGFVLIGVNDGEEADQVAMFASSLNLTFPVWLDPQGSTLRAFRTTSLPSSFVIDRSGQVRLAWTGAIDRETLEEYVTPIIVE